MLRVGTGGTAAGATTQIGTTDITLPAGGPWTIHHIWGQVVKDTTVPNEGTGGALVLFSPSGDLTPPPSPGNWPLIGSCVSESANSAISAVPLNLWRTNLQAPGKATLRLSYLNQLAITTGSDVMAGIIFSDNLPEAPASPFCDGVRTAFASTAEQSVGTITLSEKATRITGILADCNKGDAATAGEPILVQIRLASDDVDLAPAQFPCNRAFNASDGTAVGQASQPQSQFIPLDIAVEGGSRINVFATSSASVTGNVEVQCFLMYE
jgi:hypothetical protein